VEAAPLTRDYTYRRKPDLDSSTGLAEAAE
jgi:hypothetical protein